MRDGALSLSPPAIGEPVHHMDPPVPVRAWIHRTRFGWKQLDGRADAWTARAVRVTFVDEHGRTDVAWLWASSVVRVPTGRDGLGRPRHRTRGL